MRIRQAKAAFLAKCRTMGLDVRPSLRCAPEFGELQAWSGENLVAEWQRPCIAFWWNKR